MEHEHSQRPAPIVCGCCAAISGSMRTKELLESEVWEEQRLNCHIYEQLKTITDEEAEILKGRREIDRGRYTSASALVVDSGKLLDTGRLIQIRPHTRFIHFPRHTHNYVEVIYMCSGKTTHIVDGDTVVLRQGELLFLSQKAVQEIFPAEEEDVAVNFIILPEFFDQALHMIGAEDNMVRKFIVGCLKDAQSDIGYLHFRVSDVLPIQNLVENLIWTIMNNQPNKRSINQVTMGLLFLQLMNYTDKVEVGKDHHEQELLLGVYRYVEEHYKDGGLSDLAGEMGSDISSLSRRIRKLTGHTYTDLVQLKRLSQARFLLETTNLPVASVGMTVGYDNLSYFHRIFRENTGMSPKQWRKAQRGQ